ncbi:hypothetical protein ON010_g16300 [Phytophthora cinnamomi]|nr:hypothetical protein ON010_g16300 [Phytophthora cinnamomi]
MRRGAADRATSYGGPNLNSPAGFSPKADAVPARTIIHIRVGVFHHRKPTRNSPRTVATKSGLFLILDFTHASQRPTSSTTTTTPTMLSTGKIFVMCIAAVALSSSVRAEREVAQTLIGGPGFVSVGVPGVASVGVGGLGVYGPGVYGPGVGVYGPGVGVYGPGYGYGYNGVAPAAAYPSTNGGGATATASASANANAYRKLRSEEE